MKTIVPIVTAVVLALALMSASAASRHHKSSHEGCHCCTATDCLHRRRLHTGSTWLPSRDGLHAGRNTNWF